MVHGTVRRIRCTSPPRKDAGKQVGKAAEKSTKVAVYYTEDAGVEYETAFKSDS